MSTSNPVSDALWMKQMCAKTIQLNYFLLGLERAETDGAVSTLIEEKVTEGNLLEVLNNRLLSIKLRRCKFKVVPLSRYPLYSLLLPYFSEYTNGTARYNNHDEKNDS